MRSIAGVALLVLLAACAPPSPTVPLLGEDITHVLPPTFAPAVQQHEARVPGTPRARLVRWWTDECPFCAASLPALGALLVEFEARGLTGLAVHHEKPPEEQPLTSPRRHELLDRARELGWRGAVAFDAGWKGLASLREFGLPEGATSVTLLLDADGRVVHWHPGPEISTTGGASEAAALEELRATLRATLGRP